MCQKVAEYNCSGFIWKCCGCLKSCSGAGGVHRGDLVASSLGGCPTVFGAMSHTKSPCFRDWRQLYSSFNFGWIHFFYDQKNLVVRTECLLHAAVFLSSHMPTSGGCFGTRRCTSSCPPPSARSSGRSPCRATRALARRSSPTFSGTSCSSS